MQKLLAFIVAKRHWFLLIVCEIFSFSLIYRNSAYQRNTIISAANSVTGSVLSVCNTVFSYFDLFGVNQELLERTARLEMEVAYWREQAANQTVDQATFGQVFLRDTVVSDSLIQKSLIYRYIPARVVNNSVNYQRNYITINKGSDDGIRQDMGVVSPRGIVGVVTNVDNRFAIVMSLLNVKCKMSCKIQHTHFSGSLSWKGGDVRYAFLEQIATHATFQVGDTIVTSGYSDIFPPGVQVGVVESFNKQNDDNFYALKVRLFTDFQSLNALCVIENRLQETQKNIEQEARRND